VVKTGVETGTDLVELLTLVALVVMQTDGQPGARLDDQVRVPGPFAAVGASIPSTKLA
jgi:hypothetical protein